MPLITMAMEISGTTVTQTSMNLVFGAMTLFIGAFAGLIDLGGLPVFGMLMADPGDIKMNSTHNIWANPKKENMIANLMLTSCEKKIAVCVYVY